MIAIINYGIGNLASILNMCKRLGIQAVITEDHKVIEQSSKLILPGIGHFDSCMNKFNSSGLRSFVERKIIANQIPVLGICVGAQMMTRGSEEGTEKGLAFLQADTIRFKQILDLKIPHMGWTDLQITRNSPLWKNLPEDPRFYFAHSYHFKFDSNSEEMVTAKCNYSYDFPCAFQHNNIYGVQFHPEKSHKYGMQLLSNFAAL